MDNKLPRYFVFAYDDFYARGGINDYVGAFTTSAEATVAMHRALADGPRPKDNAEVLMLMPGGLVLVGKATRKAEK